MKKYTKSQIREAISYQKSRLNQAEDGFPVKDLGKVLMMGPCDRQLDMSWGYDGIVFAHKEVNPEFDKAKPFVVLMHQDEYRTRSGKDLWQIHFENFGQVEGGAKPKVLDDMYKAVAWACPPGFELYLAGHCTPGGISGISRLKDYGFKKKWLPYGALVEWGAELDPDRLQRWLNSGKHDDEFLVYVYDKTFRRDVERRPLPGDVLTPENTKPRPFKMVRESARRNNCSKLHERSLDSYGYRRHYIYHCKPFGKILQQIKLEKEATPSSKIYIALQGDLDKERYLMFPVIGLRQDRASNVLTLENGKDISYDGNKLVRLDQLERAFKSMSDNETGCLVDQYFFPKKTLDLWMAVTDYCVPETPEGIVVLIVDAVDYSVIDDDKEKPSPQRTMYRQIDDDPPPNARMAMTKDGKHVEHAEQRLPLHESDDQILYWAHMLDEAFDG